MIDHEKLHELAQTLTDDQRRLLREGLAGGREIDEETLTISLRSFDSGVMFDMLASEPVAMREVAETPDGGPGDGGGPDAGTGRPKPQPKPKPEPPLTRW